MDSASIQFVLFGLIAAVLSGISRSSLWRSTILMLASLVFLVLLARNPIVLVPLVGFLLLGYVALALLQSGMSKVRVYSILTVLLTYIWLKKYSFLPEGIFLHFPYFALGLSYIFFRVLHLLIEAGEPDQPRISPAAYLLYNINFTTFVSGPIQRYDEFAADQFAADPIALEPRVIGLQLERIIRGFFKVNVLALLLHNMQQDALAQVTQPLPLQFRLFAAFRMAVVYPFFLYANFSGYIDIVIAIARLMRVRLPENFDRPFSAASFIDFWNRWHITLSAWLKNYVYNPLLLVLMRRISSLSLQPFLGVLCFFVTFFLVGIWHGRTSEFLMYGLILGGGISINKLWQVRMSKQLGRKGYKALAANPVYIAFARGLTFTWFAFSLFWLWARWAEIDRIFSALGAAQWLAVWLAIWLCATVSLALWERSRAALLSIKTSEGPVLESRYARVIYATALCYASIAVALLLNHAAPDIVYKAF
jgi:alginate O-acetyltransferase complex protein AlgI